MPILFAGDTMASKKKDDQILFSETYAVGEEKRASEKELDEMASSIVANQPKERPYKESGGLYDVNTEDKVSQRVWEQEKRKEDIARAKFEPESNYPFMPTPQVYEKPGREGVYSTAVARYEKEPSQLERDMIHKEGVAPTAVKHIVGGARGLNEFVSEQKLRFGAAKDLGISGKAFDMNSPAELKRTLDLKRKWQTDQKLSTERSQASTAKERAYAKRAESESSLNEARARAVLMQQSRQAALTQATLEQVSKKPVKFGSRNFGSEPIYIRGGIPITHPRDRYTINTSNVGLNIRSGNGLAAMRSHIFKGSTGPTMGMQLPDVIGGGARNILATPRRYPLLGGVQTKSDVISKLSAFMRKGKGF